MQQKTPALALSIIPGSYQWACEQLRIGRRVMRRSQPHRRIVPHGKKWYEYVDSARVGRYRPIGLDILATDWITC